MSGDQGQRKEFGAEEVYFFVVGCEAPSFGRPSRSVIAVRTEL
jgi:hypothetical protein